MDAFESQLNRLCAAKLKAVAAAECDGAAALKLWIQALEAKVEEARGEEPAAELRRLRALKRRAVEAEEYLEAAALKRQIQVLESPTTAPAANPPPMRPDVVSEATVEPSTSHSTPERSDADSTVPHHRPWAAWAAFRGAGNAVAATSQKDIHSADTCGGGEAGSEGMTSGRNEYLQPAHTESGSASTIEHNEAEQSGRESERAAALLSQSGSHPTQMTDSVGKPGDSSNSVVRPSTVDGTEDMGVSPETLYATPPTKVSSQPAGPDSFYEVVHACIAVRDAPSLTATVLTQVPRRRGVHLFGTPYEIDGSPWLRLDGGTSEKLCIEDDNAWTLIRSDSPDVGVLLRTATLAEPTGHDAVSAHPTGSPHKEQDDAAAEEGNSTADRSNDSPTDAVPETKPTRAVSFQSLGPDAWYEMAHTRVAVRTEPTLTASALTVLRDPSVLLHGSPYSIDGNPWLRLDASTSERIEIDYDVNAWVLINGECVGLGALLRPLPIDDEEEKDATAEAWSKEEWKAWWSQESQDWQGEECHDQWEEKWEAEQDEVSESAELEQDESETEQGRHGGKQAACDSQHSSPGGSDLKETGLDSNESTKLPAQTPVHQMGATTAANSSTVIAGDTKIRLYSERIDVAMRAGDVATAVAVLQRRGLLYRLQGDFDLALADMDACVAVVPEDAKSHYCRAIARLEVGGWDKEAYADLRAAQRLGLNTNAVQRWLSRARHWMSQPQRKNHYRNLGTPADAPVERIKEAYRLAALRWHPDKPGGDAEHFRRVREAWEVLGDKDQRREYDYGMASDRRERYDVHAARPVPVRVIHRPPSSAQVTRKKVPNVVLPPRPAHVGRRQRG